MSVEIRVFQNQKARRLVAQQRNIFLVGTGDFLFGGVGGGGVGDRSNCKMRMMFLCREVKLPTHCSKAVEMLERGNSGSKLGK